MAGNRKYKVGTYPIYDQTFDRLVTESLILNPSGASSNDIRNFGTVSMLQSRSGIQRLLMEHQGKDGTGYYILNRLEVPSKITEAEQMKQAVKEKFSKLKQRAINSGKFPPKEMDSEMKEALLKAEAAQDIVTAEIKRLENALTNFPVEEAGALMPCLKYGAIGSSKNRGGILVVVDGQTVSPDAEGVLRIKDKKSPYHGMRSADYFESIVLPYKREQAKLLNAHQANIHKAVKENKDPAAIPKNRPPLPKWPEDIPRYNWLH